MSILFCLPDRASIISISCSVKKVAPSLHFPHQPTGAEGEWFVGEKYSSPHGGALQQRDLLIIIFKIKS